MRIKQLALASLLVGLSSLAPSVPHATAQEATPIKMVTCEDIDGTQNASTPGAMTGDMAGMDMATPMAEMDHMSMELDQTYIDMMITHHESIIAMAQAARSRVADERLHEIARAIIDSQSAEIAELLGYREAFYGKAEPMPMDESMMAAMDEMMPGMGDMEAMALLMDAEALMTAFCASEDADLAFIDLTIPHHQMAIDASEVVLDQGTHAEIQELARQVIDAQLREIAELTEIGQRWADSATPGA